MKKRTKINIIAGDHIDSFVLQDLYTKEKVIKNNTTTSIELSWQLLTIPNPDIREIEIDGCQLQKFIKTGYYENNKFKIWIHPNIGYMISTLMDQINVGDLNDKLYKKYLLTVDRPIDIGREFPVHIQGFFAHGSGPKWWNKEKRPIPYIVIDDPEIKEMMTNIKLLEKHLDSQADFSGKKNQTLQYNDKWRGQGWKMESYSRATAKDFNADSFSGFGKHFQKIGFKKLYQVYTAYLGPLGYINLHTDGNEFRKKENAGNTRLYCSYSNTDAVYFKMLGVGLLPMNTPILIDAGRFVHSVVNLSKTNTRKSLVVTGIF